VITVEDLLQQLAQDRKAYGDLLVKTQQLEDQIDTTERRLKAQIAIAPGGKLYHAPSGMVYGIKDDKVTIVEAMYQTSQVELSDPYCAPDTLPIRFSPAAAEAFTSRCNSHECCDAEDVSCRDRMVVS